MKLINSIIKVKPGVLSGPNLKKAFNDLILEVENIQGSMRLPYIFELISKELTKNGIDSVITVVDEKKNEIVIKSVNVTGKLKDIFTTENLKKEAFMERGCYKTVIENKQVIFCQDRLAQIKKIFNEDASLGKNVREKNSVIAPLVLRGEIIGTIEMLSSGFKNEDLEIVDDFVKKLVISITNNILFYEIRESERRYKYIFQNASDGLVFFNMKEKKFKESNLSMRKIVGYTNEELKHLHYLELFHGEERLKIEDIVNMIIMGKDRVSLPIKCTMKIVTKKNETKICDIEVGVHPENEEIFFSFYDVTSQRFIETALRESEEKYRVLIDNAGDGVIVFDLNGTINFVNRAAMSILEGGIEKLIGKKMMDFVHEKDREMVEMRLKDRIMDRRTVSNFDFRIVTIKKKVKHINYSSTLIKKGGKIINIQVIIRDITKNKLAEEENQRLTEFVQKILDSSPASIVVLNKEGRIVLNNGMAKMMFGNRIKGLIGQKLVETRGISQNDELINNYELLLYEGKPFYYDNLPYVSFGSGKKKYLNIIAVPLFDKNKKVDGVISMAIDNTEKVLAKQKLVDLNKQLEIKVEERTKELDIINKELSKVLELKSKFISDASHELRTPLTVIQGNLDLAKQEYVSKGEEVPEAFMLIGKEVEQMTVILADLTMLTNTDASSEIINYDNVDLNLLSAAVTQSLKVLAAQKKIDIKLITDENGAEIIGDENKLEKLLINLVRNAIKYTEENGKIEIRIQKEGDIAKMIVMDNGIGIPENDLPYIFERFYRVDKARSRQEGGTGLGLSICRWIAEAHGGNISVESKLGKGTTFTVVLPIDCRNHQVKR